MKTYTLTLSVTIKRSITFSGVSPQTEVLISPFRWDFFHFLPIMKLFSVPRYSFWIYSLCNLPLLPLNIKHLSLHLPVLLLQENFCSVPQMLLLFHWLPSAEMISYPYMGTCENLFSVRSRQKWVSSALQSHISAKSVQELQSVPPSSLGKPSLPLL